jgi:hypothetical protein
LNKNTFIIVVLLAPPSSFLLPLPRLHIGIFKVLLVRKAQRGEQEGKEKRRRKREKKKKGKGKERRISLNPYVFFTLIQYESKQLLKVRFHEI